MSQKTDEILTFLKVRQNKARTEEFAKAVIQSGLIDDFMEVFLNSPAPIPERAAWVISMIGDIQPVVFNPFVPQMINLLEKENHQAVERGVMRTLHACNIPEESEGQLLDICFKWLADPQKLVAAKVHAMETAYKLSIQYPELLQELEQVILDGWDRHTVAYQSRGRKIIKRIKKQLAIH